MALETPLMNPAGRREPRPRPIGRAERLAPFLERLYSRYHEASFIRRDPLRWARSFNSPGDQEIAAFIAASLAYGNVVQIDRSLGELFKRIGPSPAAFARSFEPGRSDRALAGFYHRFNTAEDFGAFFHLLGQMLRGWGSIEGFWAAAQAGHEGEGDIADRAGRFIHAALELDLSPYRRRVGSPPGLPFRYLWPEAAGTSACKRLNLFLRWVVRPADGIDLGLWTFERPAELQFPVDTHILRLARYLGATRRKDAGARTRREITAFFRRIDPADPVRFDFSLCRLGILKECPIRSELAKCESCELRPGCLRHARMIRGATP